VEIAVATALAPVGKSGRATYRARRARGLTLAQEAEIRMLAGTRSLRSLAADFGVSHETVRAVLRGTEAEVA
jgi:hypothetical protein